jgi:hypothetical protein
MRGVVWLVENNKLKYILKGCVCVCVCVRTQNIWGIGNDTDNYGSSSLQYWSWSTPPKKTRKDKKTSKLCRNYNGLDSLDGVQLQNIVFCKLTARKYKINSVLPSGPHWRPNAAPGANLVWHPWYKTYWSIFSWTKIQLECVRLSQRKICFTSLNSGVDSG